MLLVLLLLAVLLLAPGIPMETHKRGENPYRFHFKPKPSVVYGCGALSSCQSYKYETLAVVSGRLPPPPTRITVHASYKSQDYNWKGRLVWSNHHQAFETTRQIKRLRHGKEKVPVSAVVKWRKSASPHTVRLRGHFYVNSEPPCCQPILPLAFKPPTLTIGPNPAFLWHFVRFTVRFSRGEETNKLLPGQHAGRVAFGSRHSAGSLKMQWQEKCGCFVAVPLLRPTTPSFEPPGDAADCSETPHLPGVAQGVECATVVAVVSVSSPPRALFRLCSASKCASWRHLSWRLTGSLSIHMTRPHPGPPRSGPCRLRYCPPHPRLGFVTRQHGGLARAPAQTAGRETRP